MKDLKTKRSLKVACHAVALAKADSVSENLYVDVRESANQLMVES
jgi:hypothetical protein